MSIFCVPSLALGRGGAKRPLFPRKTCGRELQSSVQLSWSTCERHSRPRQRTGNAARSTSLLWIRAAEKRYVAIITSSRPMTAKYSPVTIDVGSWRLRTQRPKVLLAQIPATYEPGEQTDRRMRHVRSAAYAERLISIINAQVDHDADFLVFPEYAWPVWAIDASVAALREHLVEGTLAILPLEHLPLGEVASVLSRFPIEASRRAAVVSELEAAAVPAQRARTIVNLCVVVIRAGGELVAFPQPKLMPAALEEHPASGWYFAPSHSLYVLAGKDVHDNAFRIATLICFDFLAKDRGQLARVRDAVLAGAPHVVFVPECNPAPMHPLYARAIASILEDARLESPPFVAFANVARGTRLPGYDKECFFGFSRAAGELGACSPSLANGYIVRSGIFAHDSPRQLADLVQPPQEIEAPDIKWVIARPQESLLSSTLPLDGTDSDPTGGRLHCEISISRGLPKNVWKLIRTSVALTPPPEPPHRVPPDLVPKTGLVGSADATRQLSEALDRGPKPTWIVGGGGIGKSALVANLAGVDPSDVVWIDMEQVGPRDGALPEALLTALGRTLALAQSEDEQWKTVREAIRAKSTLVVLDSFEKAELASVPAPLLNALGWKARLVVTSRALLVDASEVEKVEVPLLTTADSKLLLRATCEGAITDAQLERASQLANGSPLACLWLATLIKAGLFPADADAAALSELQQIFARTMHDLTVVDKSVLAACCQLPAAVRIEDLATMVSMDPAAIMVSARRLQDRALCSLENGTLRPRHPFVRQFTRDSGMAPDVFPKCLAWVAAELGRHGGDRTGMATRGSIGYGPMFGTSCFVSTTEYARRSASFCGCGGRRTTFSGDVPGGASGSKWDIAHSPLRDSSTTIRLRHTRCTTRSARRDFISTITPMKRSPPTTRLPRSTKSSARREAVRGSSTIARAYSARRNATMPWRLRNEPRAWRGKLATSRCSPWCSTARRTFYAVVIPVKH